MLTRERKRTQVATFLGLATAGALLLSACSDTSATGSSSDGENKEFTYLSFAENTSIKDTLTTLSTTIVGDSVSDTMAANVTRKIKKPMAMKPNVPDSGVKRPKTSIVVESALTAAPSIGSTSRLDSPRVARRA